MGEIPILLPNLRFPRTYCSILRMVDTFKNKRNHVLKPGVLLLTIFFLFGKSFSQPAEEEQFLIDYNLEYNISENGETNVIHKTTITNIQNDHLFFFRKTIGDI